MLRKMGMLIAALAFGAAANAEELREIEYEKIYDSFVEKRVSGRYIKSSPVISVKNSATELSALKVFIETHDQTRLEVDIDTNLAIETNVGVTNFPLDETLFGSKVITNAPPGGFGVGMAYEIDFKQGDSLSREEIVGSVQEYRNFIDGLGFFSRLLAPDLTGFGIPVDGNKTMTATIGTQVIKSENSKLFLPVELVMQDDYSEIKFSSVPYGVYLSVE